MGIFKDPSIAILNNLSSMKVFLNLSNILILYSLILKLSLVSKVGNTSLSKKFKMKL